MTFLSPLASEREEVFLVENIRVKILNKSSNPLPAYAHDGDSGLDIRSNDWEILAPGEVKAIPTGLFVEIPPGYEIQIRPRSGLALNQQVTVLNTPGTIDSNYRGEIKVILANFSSKDFSVNSGDRIAQIVLQKVPHIMWQEVKEDLSETSRGESGFGSTGKD